MRLVFREFPRDTPVTMRNALVRWALASLRSSRVTVLGRPVGDAAIEVGSLKSAR